MVDHMTACDIQFYLQQHVNYIPVQLPMFTAKCCGTHQRCFPMVTTGMFRDVLALVDNMVSNAMPKPPLVALLPELLSTT
jgi:hypothetical protein